MAGFPGPFLLFEVGFLRSSDDAEALPRATVIGVHPLLVSPSEIRYKDASRSALDKTATGSAYTIGGRGLRSVSLRGNFGLIERAVGPYAGNGEVRFRRFYDEVVRLGEALQRRDVDAALNVVTGTPGLTAKLASYDPATCAFYVNFYDFWNEVSFQVLVESFDYRRQHKGGGATGIVWYDMTLKEIGPPQTSGISEKLLAPLLDTIGYMRAGNEVLKSYTQAGTLDALDSLTAPFADVLLGFTQGMTRQIDTILGLLGAQSRNLATRASNTGLSLAGVFAELGTTATAAQDMADALRRGDGEEAPPVFPAGALRFDAQPAPTSGQRMAQRYAVLDVRDYAETGAVMGAYFGMNRTSYQAFIEGGGQSKTDNVGGSIKHTVTDTDTAIRLESLYGVPWRTILQVNRLDPDDALRDGTELLIPRVRPRGPLGVAGLPTFGSHLGQEAWGADLPPDFEVDDDGDLAAVSGPDVLVQGIQVLVAEYGEELMDAVEAVPEEGLRTFIARRMQQILLSDRRISAVQGTEVTQTAAGDYALRHTVVAINGGQIRTGGP
jgi:hypothetical protein